MTPEMVVASLRDIEARHRNQDGHCALDGDQWPCLHKATLSIHIANDLLAAEYAARLSDTGDTCQHMIPADECRVVGCS